MQAKYYLVNFDPVAVSIGPLDIHWYGIMYLLAFLAFWWLGNLRAMRHGWRGWSRSDVADMLFYGMLGVIIGGRVGYMLLYGADMLARDPLSLLRVWDGGMSFHGGLLGVMVAMAWLGHKTGKSFWQVADFVAPLVPVGLALGRVGNFIGGELWGRLSDVPWAMIFAKTTGFRPGEDLALREAWQTGALDHLARHPSQLYQASLEGLALFVILMWYSRRPRPRAAVSGLFLAGYGVFRFIVEIFRQPDDHMGYLAMHWLTMGMVLSLPMVAAGIIIMLIAYQADPEYRGSKSE